MHFKEIYFCQTKVDAFIAQRNVNLTHIVNKLLKEIYDIN